MAKIKQIKMTLGLNPQRPYSETTVAINYNSTDKRSENYRRPIPPENERFFIYLPQVVADALGVDQVKAGDQDEVVVKFKELIEQYKSMDTEVNQVILYSIKVEPDPADKPGRSLIGWRKVEVWAGTYEETVAIAGNSDRRYSYARVESAVNFADLKEADYIGPSRRPDGKYYPKQVPWTEQNATFFVWIKDNMNLLIERLHELEQPEKLVEAIEAGRLLPLGRRPAEG